MFFGLQPIHIVFILLVALLLFGPKRLPEMGRNIGKALNEFRNGTREITDSLRAEVNGSPEPVAASMKPAVSPPQSVPFQAQTIMPPRTGNFCIHCGAVNQSEARF